MKIYNNQQIILLNVISGIMSIVYPSEKLSWPIPPVDFENNYTAALNSAKKGVYDFSVGTSDFLELTLPSLVLITAPSLKNYYQETAYQHTYLKQLTTDFAKKNSFVNF
jgi:hypothetical protein